MKTRILSSIVGLIVLAVVLVFFNTLVLNVALSIICMIAVWELLHSTGYVKNTPLLIASMIYAAVFPFLNLWKLREFFIYIAVLYVLIAFLILFIKHENVKFEAVAVSLTGSTLLAYALSSMVYIRDLKQDTGFYYIMFILASAWVADAGAYFVGRKFGKHKMAPKISPKKSYEGLVGGFVICLIFNIALTVIYANVKGMSVNYVALVIISVIAIFVGVFGDLSASVIKRQTGIKDFGNLIPGHGGIIDRFDSVLFICPAVYIALGFLDIVYM